jgi:phosphate starvation-inducible PhoH-like protein
MYDALADLMSYDKMRRYVELGVIEIAPLAFMRGRTLHNSYVILDEAQNTTVRQMKMFLTRMGVNSRCVITGDITQIDLKDPDSSGLVRIQQILGHVADIRFIYFHPEDVVRHRLVRDIRPDYHARQNGGTRQRRHRPRSRSGHGRPGRTGASPEPARTGTATPREPSEDGRAHATDQRPEAAP